jgi:hypothetical protein
MKTPQQLALQIEETLSSIADWEQLGDFISQFHQLWLKLGQQVQQILVQQKIEEKEAQYQGARTKREKKYYTPLGEIQVKRRVYSTPNGLEIKVDRALGLPREKWFPQVLELACALGINIDYKSYLEQGLMIGSGVVESSNRRVVTQRLKQAGMHWSKLGAEGIMALRAAYLSQTNRWSIFFASHRVQSELIFPNSIFSEL